MKKGDIYSDIEEYLVDFNVDICVMEDLAEAIYKRLPSEEEIEKIILEANGKWVIYFGSKNLAKAIHKRIGGE